MDSTQRSTPTSTVENNKTALPERIVEAIARIQVPEREYLQKRGVDLALAANLGVRTVGTNEQPWDPEHYGVKGWKELPCPVLAFPYPFTRDLRHRCAHRLRLRTTTKVIDHSTDGAPDEIKTYPKFIASSGMGAMPYIVGKTEKREDPAFPAFVMEGPAKALSWASAMFAHGVFIGLGGVEAGAHDAETRRDSGLLRPHPMLQQCVKWEGRTAYVVMDAGRVNNPNVARGEARTAALLAQLGASVRLVEIPLHQGEDQGPDDWLVRAIPEPAEPYTGRNRALGERRRAVIEQLLARTVPADPVERAKLVRSTEEARQLLGHLPFQASLAINEDAVVGLVLGVLRPHGIDRAAVRDAIKKFRTAVRHKTKKDEPTWKANLARSAQGQIVSSIANVMDVIRNDERLVGVLGFDEFAFRPMLMKAPPWQRHGRVRLLTDADVVRLAEWLEREHRLRIAPNSLHRIVDARSREMGFHPVQSYLGQLRWDGTERVAGRAGPGWLTLYFGVADDPYVRLVGRLWLISAVARARKPGCKVDTMLILEGKQGLKKSTALRVLFGDDWFSDSLSDLGTKDSFQELLGKWGIEMSELDALTRAEATRAKQFMTKQSDYFRDSYGRLAQDHLRQCVFAGTINAAEYLKDWTGGRRYWPVLVTQVDIEALRRDRDQLWAEADKLYKDGERWWVETKEEEALCGDEQEARRIPLRYEEEVTEVLDGIDAVTAKYVVSKLEVALGDQRSVETTVGRILQRLDWTQGRKKIDGVRTRYYVRPRTSDTDPGPTVEEINAALEVQRRGAASTPDFDADLLSGL